jgi:thioredoxin-like negative regulator of GroEL
VLACDSCNPVLVMMLAQAYFAAGDYRGAAAATQAAMQELPQDRWGVVVSNRNELYCNPKSYSFQLQQLENAVNDHPNDPAQRFLLAFQYAYLGYPQAAVGQLDKVIELEPRDEMAVHLRKALEPLLPKPGAPVITPGVVSRD